MPQAVTSEISEMLLDATLVSSSELEQARAALGERAADPKEFTDELMRRRLLTAFQSERLLLGKGNELVLGPYVLLERLGQGGMGEVFKARHRLLNRIVALKITRKELLADPLNERRFLREIQATARLGHPNIVTVHDAARVGDVQFFTMEYIEGADLARLVKQNGPLPIPRACDYIRQAALGLQHAFEHGLVHRDIKPSNLLVTADGLQVKILDMGVVRLPTGEGSDLTATGTVVGTPDYLSPEQATNSRAVDIRADLYSLGCTLFHALTGRAPFPEGSGLEKVLKHLHDPPPPLRTIRQEIPPELVLVAEKLMAKKPADRYQKPCEVVEALAPFCPGATKPTALPPPPPPPPLPPAAKPAPEPEKPPPVRRSHRLAVAAVALLLLLAGVGLAYRHPWDGSTDSGARPPITNSIGMELVYIPAGSFSMGSPVHEEGRREDEGPMRDVTITRPFYLAAHETTRRQFRMFTDAMHHTTDAEENGEGTLEWNADKNKWQMNSQCKWRNPGGLPDEDHPVVCVTRRDAEVFCYWLSKKENRTYRLPTEAEWEYACRASTETPYSMGVTLTLDQARFQAERSDSAKSALSKRRTARVASCPANPWGLFDMHGNVWEWCADYYSPTFYREGSLTDPHNTQDNGRNVARGGSWQSGNKDCRAAARLDLSLTTRRTDIGFRVVLEAGVR